MLYWTLIFLVLSLVAAVFGYSGVAGEAAGIARILFFVFLAMLVVSLIYRGLTGRDPTRTPLR